MDRKMKFNKKLILPAALGLILVLILGWLGLTVLLDPYDCRILPNVTISDIPVGGMTYPEALQAVKAAAGDYATEPMTVALPQETIALSPEQTGTSVHAWKAVHAAYTLGRSGDDAADRAQYEACLAQEHVISILPFLSREETVIRAALESYAQKYDIAYSEPSYTMQGAMPSLYRGDKEESVQHQTLVLTMGTPEQTLDVENMLQAILEAYDSHRFFVTVSQIPMEKLPPQPDLEKIYEETYFAPVNAQVDRENYTVIPGENGYGFDLEHAAELVSKAAYGETLSLPMAFIPPEIDEENVYFQDVLGSCETVLNTNENRNTNLRLVCEILDGMILQPGEEFSYNDTIGERTAARGFKPAPAYAGTTLVDSIGGGVCQGSSTLYYCCLLADFEIIERINHGYVARYLPMGMDATVNWNGPDYKFRNSSNFPIQLKAWVEDGYVHMQILGVDEKDYYIEMEYKITGYIKYNDSYKDGYYVKTFKNKFDKETGELLSSDYEASSSYRG